MQSRHLTPRFQTSKPDRDIPVSADVSYDPEVDDAVERVSGRELGDILNEIRDYLTKEELICIALFKNSRKQQNQIYRVFLERGLPEKYGGRHLSSSAITHKKNKILRVLQHVGALIRFKQEHHVDTLLKNLLTTRQHVVLSMYERRLSTKEMQTKLGKISAQSLSKRYARSIERLEAEDSVVIKRYLELLGNVLRFSRKRNIQ